MLGAGIVGIVGRGRSLLRLTFEVVQGRFGGQSDDRVLAIYLFLVQFLKTYAHAGLWAQRDDTEAFWLPIGAVLEELHLVEVVYADVADRIGYVLIGCPLKKINGENSLTETFFEVL